MNEDQFARLYDKLEKTDEKIGEINITLASQAVELKEHIRRTALLEEHMAPVKKHVDVVQALALFLLKALTVIGVIAGIYKAFFA